MYLVDVTYDFVVLEVRPRLQSVNLFVSLKLDHDFAISDVRWLPECILQVLISSNVNSIATRRIRIDLSQCGIRFCTDVTSTLVTPIGPLSSMSDNGFLVRLRSQPSNADLGSFAAEVLSKCDSKSDEIVSDIPYCLKTVASGDSVIVKCSNCHHKLSTSPFILRRVLPLPSSSWRDFSQEWFCGCPCVHKSTLMDHENEHKGTRKSALDLPSDKVEPKTGDILYSPTHISVSSSLLHQIGISSCPICHQEICQISKSTSNVLLKLWNYSVRVVSALEDHEDQALECSLRKTQISETFLGMIKRVVGDSGHPGAARIVLSCSTSSYLLVWVLESSLPLVVLGGGGSSLSRFNVFKVLWTDNAVIHTKWKRDYNVEHEDVSLDLMDEGRRLFVQSQKLIHPNLRVSDGFNIGYLCQDIEFINFIDNV